MDHFIFGPNVILPSIEGVKSACEDELCVLMKEIDLAFGRKYKDLLGEVSQLKASCQTKDEEIKSLRSTLQLRTQNNKQNLEDHTSHLVMKIAKLKEENSKLKTENAVLQSKVTEREEVEKQLESLKRSLTTQQEENASVREKFTQLSEKHWTLEETYQRMRNMVDIERKGSDTVDKRYVQQTPSDFINLLIAEETEKNQESESEHLGHLQSQISDEIEKLRRTLRENDV